MTLESIAGAAGAWLWDTYGKDITAKALDTAKERWAKFNWSQAAEKYRQQVKVLYGTTRILGNPKPISLEGIFTDAYLLDKPTALRRFDLEQLRAMVAERESLQPHGERRSALDLALQEKRLFILGKPGAGKTTFLKYVAWQAANSRINKIPIFVSLKEWADSGLALMPFLVEQFKICAFPEAQPFIEYLLNAGQAIVLFDGLDEVNQEDEQHAHITLSVNNFSKQYPASSCLITCRIAATDFAFDHFTYVEMADFDDAQIRVFAGKWFKDNPAKHQKFLEEFEKAEQRGLRELAQIPLLLTLLCLAFDETMSFPQRRVELYEEALDALLKKWDSSRNIKRDEIYRKLSLGRKRQMLTRIAAETFERGDYFIRQADLAHWIKGYLQRLPPTDTDEDIDGETVLKAVEAQHGLLVERAHRIYSFSHLTFQEYFTAKFFAESDSESRLALLMLHLTHERWREVFLLTASLLDNTDTFFKLAQAAVNDLIRNDPKLVEIVRWARQKAARDYGVLGYEGRKEALAHDLALASELVIARNLDHDPTPFLAHALARDLALALAIPFDHDVDLDIDLDRTLLRLLNLYLDCARIHAQELHLPELQAALVQLVIPSNDATPEEGQTFADNLQAIMIRHRDIGHNWNLTSAQLKQLWQYHTASELLADCLKSAYVSDRAGIESRLWLLPEA